MGVCCAARDGDTVGGAKAGMLTIKWTPAQLTGKDGFKFLEEKECPIQYKNYAEVQAGLNITRLQLLAFYERQISHFPPFVPTQEGEQIPMVSIASKAIAQGLNPQIPTVCIRLHFTGQAATINYLLNCILDLKKRYAWDRSLTDQRHVAG